LFAITNIMIKRKSVLLPKDKRILSNLGENVRLARLRRKLSMEKVAERANVSRSTLWNIEKGAPQVAIGKLIRVLSALNLEKDLQEVAKDDELGRKLQDAKLLTKQRAPRKESE